MAGSAVAEEAAASQSGVEGPAGRILGRAWMREVGDGEVAGGRVRAVQVGNWGGRGEARRSETSEKPVRDGDPAGRARPGQEMRRPSREQAGRGAANEAQTSR